MGHLGHLAGGQCDFRSLSERFAHQLRHPDQSVALTAGQIESFICYLAGSDSLDAQNDAIHTLIHVSKIEHLLRSEESDGFMPADLLATQPRVSIHSLDV